jgi:hypothetical protein
MDIGNVLRRAWEIIWKHKVLWIFGIRAGCSGGGGGGGGGSNVQFGREGNVPPGWEPFFRQFETIPDWQIALIVLVIILVVLVFVVLGIFLGTIGRIGLIRGTQQAEGGATSLSFGELFSGSTPYFWRVFGLNLLVGLALALLGITFAILAIVSTIATFGISLACLLPLICILVPVAWFVSVIVEQASIAIVLENLGVLDGLRRGWQVVRENLGTMILMALILVLGVSFIGGVIIALPILMIVVPAVIGASVAGDDGFGGVILAVVCFVSYLPVLLVLSGILRSYIETAWTLTFMRLTAAKPAEPAELQPSIEG